MYELCKIKKHIGQNSLDYFTLEEGKEYKDYYSNINYKDHRESFMEIMPIKAENINNRYVNTTIDMSTLVSRYEILCKVATSIMNKINKM